MEKKKKKENELNWTELKWNEMKWRRGSKRGKEGKSVSKDTILGMKNWTAGEMRLYLLLLSFDTDLLKEVFFLLDAITFSFLFIFYFILL